MNSNNILIINKPEKIYIPVLDNDATILTKPGDYVYKEAILGYTKGDNKQYIYSTVSGHIEDINTSLVYLNGIKETKSLIIQNDFKEIVGELKGANKIIDNITKDEFINCLMSNYLLNKNGEALYLDYLNPLNDLIINVSDNDDSLSEYYLTNYFNEILETIDAMAEINKIKRCFLVINKNNKKLVNLIEQHIGTYLNIKLVKIRKKLSNDDIFKTYKIDNSNHFEDVKTIYHIYDVLKNNNPLTDTIIYFNDNNNIRFIKVKIGTLVEDLFNILNINSDEYIINNNFKLNNKKIIINQLLNGISINN